MVSWMLLVSILTVLDRAQGHNTVQLVKVKAQADRLNHRDFLVNIRVSSRATAWPITVLFDTGSRKFWVDLDTVSSRKATPQRGYILSQGDVSFPDNDPLVYTGGVSLKTTRGVKETIFLQGLSRPLKVDLFINEQQAVGLEHSFGMGGVIGATPNSQFTQTLGPFYFIPGNKRMWMVVGDFKHENLCHRPLVMAALNMLGRQQGYWMISASIGVGRGQATLPNQNILFDTGGPLLELPQPLWDRFTALIAQSGGTLSMYQRAYYMINGCNLDRLPPITISIPGFAHEILPKHYVEAPPGPTQQCILFAQPKPMGDMINVGTQMLTHLITWWDPKKFRMGFCHTRSR